MASVSSSPPAAGTPSNSEPRLCWICQQDETEDETPMVWRAPCPCSLTAHDECLLEWITAQETMKKDEGNYNAPIQCPQCQTTIIVERPHDYIVQAYAALFGVVKACVIPTALSGLLGCVYSGFLVYGVNTVQLVFGHAEAQDMLANMYPRPSLSSQWLRLTRETLRLSLTAFDPFFPEIQTNSDWRIFAGLPLIGPSLILLRTRFGNRGLSLPLLLYFIDPRHRRIDLTRPLSPGLAFAALPYIAGAYNLAYSHYISPHEKRWGLAVLRKPREGETAADVAAEAQEDQAGPVIEIQMDEVVVEDDGEAGNFEVVRPPVLEQQGGVEAEQANQPAVPPIPQMPEAGQPQINGPVPPPPLAAVGVEQPAPNADDNNWQMRRDIPLRHVVTTTMGALFLPTVASYSGEILKHMLPSRLVYKHVGMRSTGWGSSLLREKWGRTILGGCLFVLLKDAVTLYVKWKMAKDFGKRRILDYTGPKRRTA